MEARLKISKLLGGCGGSLLCAAAAAFLPAVALAAEAAQPPADAPAPAAQEPEVEAPATPANVGASDRELNIAVTIDAHQEWHDGLQWSKSTSQQRYEMVTRLRTDGRLMGANLLDLDQDRRIAIKREFMRRRGLENAKRMNGGKLDIPQTPEEKQKASEKVQEEMEKCNGDPDCMTEVVERASAVFAQMEDATDTKNGKATKDLGAALLDQPGRYLYFFPYKGCPSRVHVTQATRIEGAKAYDKAKKNLVPFVTTRDADYAGDAHDRTYLCSHFTGVVDTQTQDIYIDNVYVPTPKGHTARTMGGSTYSEDGNLPLVTEALGWITANVRKGRDHGDVSANLHIGMPIDADSTVGGVFDGIAKVHMTWTFQPVAPASDTTPAAPASAPAK